VPAAPEEPLPPLRDWRPHLRVGIAVLALIAAGELYWLHTHQPPPPEAPAHRLFREQLPAWVSALWNAKPQDAELEACLQAAQPWPEVRKALERLPHAIVDRHEMLAVVRQLNAALRGASLDFWVDVEFYRGVPMLMTYEVLGRSPWHNTRATVDVLEVRRLDSLTFEIEAAGHSSRDQSVVLRDHVELEVMNQLIGRTPGTGDDDEEENAANDDLTSAEAAARLREIWMKHVGALVGADALDAAAQRLARREELLHTMESRLRGGALKVHRPGRLILGDAYFDNLEQYTSTRLKGGPLLLSSDLRDAREADAAVAQGDGFKALNAAVELAALAVEAHEAHHALDHRDLPPPLLLGKLVGDADDPEFGRLAERELRAYLGSLLDAKAPGFELVDLAMQAVGPHATATPHFFAAHTILIKLGKPAGGYWDPSRRNTVELVKELCALPDAELRERVQQAATALYGAPLERAQPGAGPAVPKAAPAASPAPAHARVFIVATGELAKKARNALLDALGHPQFTDLTALKAALQPTTDGLIPIAHFRHWTARLPAGWPAELRGEWDESMKHCRERTAPPPWKHTDQMAAFGCGQRIANHLWQQLLRQQHARVVYELSAQDFGETLLLEGRVYDGGDARALKLTRLERPVAEVEAALKELSNELAERLGEDEPRPPAELPEKTEEPFPDAEPVYGPVQVKAACTTLPSKLHVTPPSVVADSIGLRWPVSVKGEGPPETCALTLWEYEEDLKFGGVMPAVAAALKCGKSVVSVERVASLGADGISAGLVRELVQSRCSAE
jgi:hypothetical protein